LTTKDYQELLPTIPRKPGVYRFIDENDVILYVGKAKMLRNRVANYFTGGKSRSYKTRALVKHAKRLEFTIVKSEHDALLLENNLIKEHQPRYNVMLRDDKTYTYICVKKERFPRVFFTRQLIKDGSIYYGPYTSKFKARIVLDLIRKLFPLRSCKYNLSEENISKGKFKVCLEYHLGNCLAPCIGLEEEEAYNKKITQVKNMLRGKLSVVKNQLKDEMQNAVENLEFEKAHKLKIKQDALDSYQSKSAVVNTSMDDIDVFTIEDQNKMAFVNYLKIVEGSIVHTHTVELTKNLNESIEDLLLHSILYVRDKYGSIAKHIIVPFALEAIEEGVTFVVPQRGDKHKLLELSRQNVLFYARQKEKASKGRAAKKTPAERILSTLKDDLHMDVMPLHVECFDNSNIQGTNPTASCVVFKNAKPSKKDYRHFKIKTVEGPDDFASMEEVVFRRYRRLLNEDEPLPQLIVIDGGKGQLSAAVKSLKKLELFGKITIIGIAKRLEEIYFPGDSIPLYINKKSESLKLIQQIRNEAHRFAITLHRNLRSKGFAASSLTDIPGIGDKTSKKLLKKFGSVKRMLDCGLEEIAGVCGNQKAQAILSYFSKNPV
jgi:excinuclease ABC subunit C